MDGDPSDGPANSRADVEEGVEDLPPVEILEQEHVYEALSHSRRRYLCYTLLEKTEWTLTELATKIVAWEADEEVSTHHLPEDRREQVYISLYHNHVPHLESQDIVEVDWENETITPDTHADQVLAALQGMSAGLSYGQEEHARGGMDVEGE